MQDLRGKLGVMVLFVFPRFKSKMVPSGPVNVNVTIQSLMWPPPLP